LAPWFARQKPAISLETQASNAIDQATHERASILPYITPSRMSPTLLPQTALPSRRSLTCLQTGLTRWSPLDEHSTQQRERYDQRSLHF
jgi:hypothetical protein